MPNIVGSSPTYNTITNEVSGCIWINREWTNSYAGRSNNWTSGFGFDASRSSTIYGNSTTVTPLSLSAKFFIKY